MGTVPKRGVKDVDSEPVHYLALPTRSHCAVIYSRISQSLTSPRNGVDSLCPPRPCSEPCPETCERRGSRTWERGPEPPKWYTAELGRLQTDEARGSNEEGDVAPHERGPPRFNFFDGEFYKARDHITVTPHPSESHLISLHARSNCMRSSL